jgi:hypothetical protein
MPQFDSAWGEMLTSAENGTRSNGLIGKGAGDVRKYWELSVVLAVAVAKTINSQKKFL